MSENELMAMHPDDLFEAMITAIQELSELRKTGTLFQIEEKQQEIYLIQRVVVERRSEFPPKSI